MHKQQNVVAILALTLLATASAQQATNNICQGVGNNIFLTDVDNCTNYFWCNNGQAISQECQPVNGQQTYFNGSGQSCVYDNSACLECPPSQLTFLPLAHSCSSYIMCFSGTPLIQTCADNLQWDSSINACNFPGLVDCVSDQCSVYSDATNVVYIPSQQSCSTYYVCMRGVAISQNCAKNTQWNPSINKCDVPANVNCTLGATSRSSVLPVPVEAQLVNINCPATGEHYYPHPQELNQYYMCVNGKGALLTCAKGLFYDAKAKHCRDLQNIAMF